MAEVKQLTGKVPAEAVHARDRRVSQSIVDGFAGVEDLSSTVSDVLDELGVIGTISASVLKLSIPGSRVVGPALTVRHDPVKTQAFVNSSAKDTHMAEVEAHNQAEPGDVLVIQSVPFISGMGGLGATIGKREGELGAIVDGGVRDSGHQRSIGYPIWSSSVTPVTGKWRIETVEVNGPVTIQGIIVYPGDLVVADDDGICFVPFDLAEHVLKRCLEIAEAEVVTVEAIGRGASVVEITNTLSISSVKSK